MIQKAKKGGGVILTPGGGVILTHTNTIGRTMRGLTVVSDNPNPKPSRKKLRARLRIVRAA